jgi:hypothetical protein
MKDWRWWLAVFVMVLLVVLLGVFAWSWWDKKSSSKSGPEGNSPYDRDAMAAGMEDSLVLSPFSASPMDHSSSIVIHDGSEYVRIPLTSPVAETSLYPFAVHPPCYDMFKDTWWVLDIEGRLYESTWDETAQEYVLSPDHVVFDTRVAERLRCWFVRHQALLLVTQTHVFYGHMDHLSTTWLSVPLPHSDIECSVLLLSDHRLLVLYITGVSYYCSLPSGYFQLLELSSKIHDPRHVVFIPEHDDFLIVTADQRSHWISVSRMDQVQHTFPFHVTAVAVHEKWLCLSDHQQERIFLYERHASWEEPLWSIEVPGGTSLQRFPPSGFGTQVRFTDSFLLVAAPFQHSVQREDESGMLYLFYVDTTGATPCHVYRTTTTTTTSSSELYHLGVHMEVVKGHVYAYAEPGQMIKFPLLTTQ